MIKYSLILNNDNNIVAYFTRTLARGNEKRGTCIVDYDDEEDLCFLDDKENLIKVPKEVILTQFSLEDSTRNSIINDVFSELEEYHYDLKYISNSSNTHELNIDLSFDRMSELEAMKLIKNENGILVLTDLGNKIIESKKSNQKKLENDSVAVTLSFSNGKAIDVMYRDNGKEKPFFDIGWIKEDKEGNSQYEAIDGKFSTAGEAISFARTEYFTSILSVDENLFKEHDSDTITNSLKELDNSKDLDYK